MNKKKWIIAAIASALLLLGIAGYDIWYFFLYDGCRESLEALTYDYEEGTVWETLEEAPDGMVMVAENSNLRLYANLETTEIQVYDKRNGQSVYSNPQEEDPIAANVNADELKSQIVIDYFTARRDRVTANNYTLSIAQKQFTYERIKDGIRFIYTIGDQSSKTGIVPMYITEERLQTAVLDKLSEADAKAVRSKYLASPEYEGHLELASGVIKSKLTLKKFQDYFGKAGYSQEDYDQDMAVTKALEEGKVSFEIPLEYRLEDRELRVSLPTKQIVEKGGGKIAGISLLKFFGAAGTGETGYMMVPNGSGSLIYFNNGSSQDAYRQDIYGTDPMNANYIVIEKTQKARLPVFGISREESAVFARITNGDSFAAITADVAGKINSYNYVYPSFTLRQSELLSMFGTTGGEADLPLVEKELYDCNLTVQYAFLDKEEADYSGMANYLRQRLMDEGVLERKTEEKPLPLYLDIVGSVQKKAFFLGIPYLTDEPMTTYKQAEEIAGLFHDHQISNLRMTYLSWFNEGYYHDMPDRVKLLGKLGGKKGLAKLNGFLENSGGKLYADAAFVQVSQNASGFSKMFESSKYYSGIYGEFGQVNPSTLRQTASLGYKETLYYLLSPRYLGHYTDRFAREVKDLELSGISLRDLGDFLASDKNKSQAINREQAKKIVKDSLQTLQDAGKSLRVKGGNYYSLQYAEDLAGVPLQGNPYYIVDEEIPFYEMVLHGCLDYAGTPVNQSDVYDKQQILLQLIETGAAPYFTLSYEESSELKYSGLNFLGSVYFEYWMEDAISIYNTITTAAGGVQNSTILRHEILEDFVRKITYDNGTVIYINYGSEPAAVDGVTVPAMDYRVKE